MKLTLRSAHKLVQKITSHIASLDVSPVAEIHVWSDVTPAQALQDQHSKFVANLEATRSLITLRQTIRNDIRVQNAEVDELVAKRKQLIDQVSVIRTIVSNAGGYTYVSGNALVERVAGIKQANGASTYGSSAFHTGVLNPDEIAELRRDIQQLQLQIEQVEDKLTAVNASKTITLSDSAVEVLREQGLIL